MFKQCHLQAWAPCFKFIKTLMKLFGYGKQASIRVSEMQRIIMTHFGRWDVGLSIFPIMPVTFVSVKLCPCLLFPNVAPEIPTESLRTTLLPWKSNTAMSINLCSTKSADGLLGRQPQSSPTAWSSPIKLVTPRTRLHAQELSLGMAARQTGKPGIACLFTEAIPKGQSDKHLSQN